MPPVIFVPFALKLQHYGLSKIYSASFDEYIKQHVNDCITCAYYPMELLHKTLPEGFLYQFGMWLVDELYLDIPDFQSMDPVMAKDWLWRFYNFLLYSGCPYTLDLSKFYHHILMISDIYEEKSDMCFRRIYKRDNWSEQVQYNVEHISMILGEEIIQIARLYATDYAGRVFHDRQFCELLANMICFIYEFTGVPIRTEDNSVAIKAVERQSWPTWVMPTLRARERGRCANCGNSFDELEGEPQVDHIVPLSLGGINDLVNLQLLCEKCNKQKGGKDQRVTSSIPLYLKWHRKMR